MERFLLTSLFSFHKCTETLSKTLSKQENYEETMELPGKRDNARNNARCTQARKTTHGLDGQHQDVDRILRGIVYQNRGQR